MPKRPDQHQIDQNEAGATDYKFSRQSEERNREDSPDDLEAGRATTQTPNEAMETRRRASEEGRDDELDRAREAREARGTDGD